MTSSPNAYNNRAFLSLWYLICGERVKKAPENPIYIVSARKGGGTRDHSRHARSFSQHKALPAAGHALTRPPGGGRACDGGAHLGGTRHRALAAPPRRTALPRGRPLLDGRAPARIGAWLGGGCQGRPGAGRLDAAAGVEAGCLRSRAAGQPAPPATARARTRSPPGTTPRPVLPAFPSGRAGPPSCPAAQPGRGAFRLSSFPWAGRPARMPAAAGRTGAGLDAAGGAERPSSRPHGRAAPGNTDRSRPAPRHPGGRPRNPG
jgi:hypothetical protein